MDKQIDIGENSKLVNEFLEFIYSDKLLNLSLKTQQDNMIVEDVDVAKKFAWEQTYGDDEFTWADLRSDKMSEIWGLIYEDEKKYSEIDNKLSSMLDDISIIVKKNLNTCHKELLDDIVSDFKGCLYSRAVQGKENYFFENILDVYLNGGWPCGWEGKWPEGHLIVYRYKEGEDN